jgi:hypothetical protein
MQGTSAGYNWQFDNNVNATGLSFTPSTAAGGTTYTTPTMVLTGAGNVGIGTTSPSASAKLDVVGTGLIRHNYTGSANPLFMGQYNTTGDASINNQATSGILSFATANSERMRIDSSGNVIVNSTAQLGIGKFSVLFAGSSNNGIELQDSTTTTGAVFSGFRNSAGTLIGSISRNTTTNAVLYNTSSDYRLKENITPLTNALDKISALKPCKWTWKDCDGIEGEGFIAHEVQEVIPAAVSGEKDAVDEEGNIKAQGMDASYLVATLTAAIQEQQTIITELKSRIEALEGAK